MLRNRIYRYLVAAKWVSIRVPNQAYQLSEKEGLPTGTPPEIDDDLTVGTLRSLNVWTETVPFQMAILRASHQVHEEATNIFKRENVWIKVQVNREDFGQDLRNRGFAVITCKNLDHVIPTLHVLVLFPSLRSLGQQSVFFMGVAGFLQLSRALWATKGMEEMVLRVELHPDVAMSEAIETELLNPFYQVRGIKKLILKGSQLQDYKTEMTHCLTTPFMESSEVLKDLQQGMTICADLIDGGDLPRGAEALDTQLAFMADCEKILRRRFLRADDKVWNEICEIGYRTAYNLARIRLILGEYETVVNYATHAMRVPPVEGVTNNQRFLLRGQAYAGLKQESKALRDLLEAQRRMPMNKSVMREMTRLMRSLDPYPRKALEAFKELRIAVREDRITEQ